MRWRTAGLGAAALLAACGGSPTLAPPTSPTPIVVPGAGTGSCPPCPPPGVYALSGVVRAGGVPVAGATVGLVKLGPQSPISDGPEDFIASVVTDGSGSYHFPQVANVSFSGALVSASKPNYLTDTRYVLMSQDRQSDLDLEPAAAITLGAITVSPIGQARCASFGYGGMGGSLCRRLSLPIAAAGSLDVAVSSRPATPFDISVLRPDGTVGIYGATSSSTLRLTLAVSPGTYQIDLVHVDVRTQEFELTTRLR